MLALYRSGRQAEALRAFQRTRAALGEELGLEPSPMLRRLEEQILVQDPALDLTHRTRCVVRSGRARGQPVQGSPSIHRGDADVFYGRDELIERLASVVAGRRRVDGGGRAERVGQVEPGAGRTDPGAPQRPIGRARTGRSR